QFEAKCDKSDTTLSESLRQQLQTPIEAIFDSITDALLTTARDGRIQSCNKVCSRYFGRSREQLIGVNIREILPGIGDSAIAWFLSPFMSSPEDTRIDASGGGDVVAQRADGSTFHVQINVSSVDSIGGNVFVISLRDITQRRQAEIALRENEERYRALVENAPEAIIVLDIDRNRFVDANDNACAFFNLSRSRMLTIGPEYISPKSQADGSPSFGVHRGYIEAALRGEHPTFEWLHQDSNGRQIPCEVRFSRLPSDDARLLRVTITNIEARKRLERLSHAQNKILEMIAAGVPCARTLRTVCKFVEKVGDGFVSAVMRLDNRAKSLQLVEAPNLPEAMRLCLDAVEVGPWSLTCGRAIQSQQDRVTTDFSKEPGWAPVSKIAAKYGIQAAWSFVLRGDADKIIGTLDVYCSEARAPSTDELDHITRLARLAGIAIKREYDEHRLRASETRYRGLFENTVDGVYISSDDGKIITANPALVEMLGYDSVEDLRSAGRTTMLYVNPIDRERVFARLEEQGYVKNFEYRLRRKDGSQIVALENSRAIFDKKGKIVAQEGTITDITERKRAETRVFEEKERAQVTLQSIGDGVITTDADGNVDYINPVAQNLTGWDLRTARGRPVSDLMMIVNENTRASCENPVTRCLREGRVINLPDDSVLITRDGEEIQIQDSAAPIRDRVGNIIGSVMVFHDISKETRVFRQLSYQASHDMQTGLINRREFENRFAMAVAALDDDDDEETHALLYVDLDQFKVVNDTFGHAAGDELLKHLADVIQGRIRSTDVLARLGGDEFGVLLERCDRESAIEAAEDIRSEVEAYRFEWQGSSTNIRCSIGVVLVNKENKEDVAGLMSAADVACYSAKEMGRNQVHFHRDNDASLRHEEMKWVSRITEAVEDERLELFYQPIVGIGGNGVPSHYELLLRMRDEDGEIVGPNQFIPAAERYNLMPTLDRWVIHESLSKLADRGNDAEARYTLALNLSGTSLSDDRFLGFVIEELEKQQLPAGAICFEITETAAISNLSRVVHFMQELKKLGCKFSLDDFGSGLSSFTYLKNLPVDYLKIDGHFIRNVAEDSVDESMVRAIREVGRAMGIKTIAERVETREVLDKLGALGVEYAQGYFIARPMSIKEFKPWEDKPRQRLHA
ncbi:MAG: EAL domain-containing protein, partial [Woeseiaceae bacterium]|nr:EAL domain-containing protein [Woeseiaceae bacterium]